MKKAITTTLFWVYNSMFILGQNTTLMPKFVFYKDISTLEVTPVEKYILKNPDEPDIFNTFIGTRISFRNSVDIAGEACISGETYASFKLSKDRRIVDILFAGNTPTSIQAMFYFAIKDSEKYWQIPSGLNEYSFLLPIIYEFDCCPPRDPKIPRISIKKVQEFAKGKIIFTDKSEVDIKDFDKVFKIQEWSCIE